MDTINKNLCYREYIIKNEDENYNLRIEVKQKYIFFTLKLLNNSLDYYYKKKLIISSFIEELNLTENFYYNKDIILPTLDNIYKEKKIKININANNDSIININFEYLDLKFDINLTKESMSIDEKLDILYNVINSKKNNNYNYIIENNISIEYLNNNKKNQYLNEINDFQNSNIKHQKSLKNEEYNEFLYSKIEEIYKEQKKLYKE